MENIKTKSDIIFSVYCPRLERTVILKRNLWFYKITPSHAEINNSHLDFIKQTLESNDPAILKYRKLKNHNKIALFKECPHFRPYDRYLKIAVELVENNEAIITTIQGVYNLPVSEMEEIV